MNFKLYTNQVSNIYAENRLLKFCFVALTITSIALAFMTYRAMEYQRVVIMPPGQLSEKIEISGSRISDSYAREFSRYVASLAFNYTPMTARSNYAELLLLFAPQTYGKAQTMFNSLVDKIETAQVSSTFFPTKVTHDPVTRTIEIRGNKNLTNSSGAIVDHGDYSYTIKYVVEHGKTSILEITEAKNATQEATK